MSAVASSSATDQKMELSEAELKERANLSRGIRHAPHRLCSGDPNAGHLPCKCVRHVPAEGFMSSCSGDWETCPPNCEYRDVARLGHISRGFTWDITTQQMANDKRPRTRALARLQPAATNALLQHEAVQYFKPGVKTQRALAIAFGEKKQHGKEKGQPKKARVPKRKSDVELALRLECEFGIKRPRLEVVVTKACALQIWNDFFQPLGMLRNRGLGGNVLRALVGFDCQVPKPLPEGDDAKGLNLEGAVATETKHTMGYLRCVDLARLACVCKSLRPICNTEIEVRCLSCWGFLVLFSSSLWGVVVVAYRLRL